MSEILRQLIELFVRSVPTVLLVFFLLVVLDRLFFRPILEVMKKRDASTSGAIEKARGQTAESEAKALKYEEAFQAARQDVYRQREAHRREGLAEREQQLAKTREQGESLLKEALDALARDVETLKLDLGRAATPLATQITETILSGGKGPVGGAKGAGN
jgi:F0F1-type ATP synthase membrane subunit b/b'